MSTENAYKAKPPGAPTEVKIVARNSLFYWWPVWAVGFVMAAITWWSGREMVAVPEHSQIVKVSPESGAADDKANKVTEIEVRWKEKQKSAAGEANKENISKVSAVVIPPEGKTIDQDKIGPTISHHKNLGVIYAIILLLVIAITNIHMRGLWSIIVVVVLLSTVIILSAYGAWDPIVEFFVFLDIRMNAGAYFFVSTVLFGLWLIVYLLYDTQTYMVFTPGSFRVRLEIGEGETAYDTRGMTIQKVRSDFFRHWILGLGSGDMIVRTSGADAKEFHLANVLFLSRKVKIIEEVLRTQVVTTSTSN